MRRRQLAGAEGPRTHRHTGPCDGGRGGGQPSALGAEAGGGQGQPLRDPGARPPQAPTHTRGTKGTTLGNVAEQAAPGAVAQVSRKVPTHGPPDVMGSADGPS